MSHSSKSFRLSDCQSVFEYGLLILNTACSHSKAALTLEAKQLFDSHQIGMGDPSQIAQPPLTPARPSNISTLSASKMPKRGKGGSLKNRIALIHSFCHIESYAIDLSWDILVRFAPSHRFRRQKRAVSQKLEELIQCLESNQIHQVSSFWKLHGIRYFVNL